MFYDNRIPDSIRRQDTHVQNFFKLLALCHTVMVDESEGIVIDKNQGIVIDKKPRNSKR